MNFKANGKKSILQIDVEHRKMQGLIELWCESNLNGDFTITRKDIPERIQFYVDSIEKKAQIDFIKCSEGRYTISFKVGPNPFVSEKIAEYLLSQIENPLKRLPLCKWIFN